MWGLCSKKSLQASEAEAARLENELVRLTGRLAGADEAYEALMERVAKERRMHAEAHRHIPQRRLELAGQALNALRHSPLFHHINPDTAPRLTADQAAQELRRLEAELEAELQEASAA